MLVTSQQKAPTSEDEMYAVEIRVDGKPFILTPQTRQIIIERSGATPEQVDEFLEFLMDL